MAVILESRRDATVVDGPIQMTFGGRLFHETGNTTLCPKKVDHPTGGNNFVKPKRLCYRKSVCRLSVSL